MRDMHVTFVPVYADQSIISNITLVKLEALLFDCLFFDDVYDLVSVFFFAMTEIN